jgi:hypothetical protein
VQKRFFNFIFLGVILLGVFGFSVLFSPDKAEAASYERLFYYREGENARKSFFAHSGSIDIFAPQSYMADKNG